MSKDVMRPPRGRDDTLAASSTRPGVSFPDLLETVARQLRPDRYDVPPAAVLDLFRTLANRHDTDLNSPFNMGYFCIDADLESLAAMEETDRRGANIGVRGQHPAAEAFECYSIRLILDSFGFDGPEAHGHYTSGGTESNLTAMVVALGEKLRQKTLDPAALDPALCRDAQGRQQEYEYFLHGTSPLKRRPTVYVTDQTHPSVEKNARTLIGTTSVRRVPMNGDLGLDPVALDRLLAADRRDGYLPFMVVGTIGATESGIVDPLEAIGKVAKRHGVWFHIDAPWGGYAAFSPRWRDACLKGVDRADSLTFDPHKTLVPLGSGGAGMFLTRHRAAAERSFNVSGMPVGDNDFPYMSLQGSRAQTGLRVLVNVLRPRHLAERIDREFALGNRLRRKLKQSGWQVMNKTPLPIVCVQHDKLSRAGITAKKAVSLLARDGILAKPVRLKPGQSECIRLGIISRRTDDDSIDTVVGRLNALL